MQKTAIRLAPPGARVLDVGGRAWVVVEDQPYGVWDVKYVCNMGGQVAMVPGCTECVWLEPQEFDTKGFMLKGWQYDVN